MDTVQRLLRQAAGSQHCPTRPLSSSHRRAAQPRWLSSSTLLLSHRPPLLSPLPSRPFRLLIIDNFDSFTHNVAAAFHSLTGSPPLVLLQHAAVCAAILSAAARRRCGHITQALAIPLSPLTSAAVPLCCPASASSPPVLGVCLGLQLLVTAHGGRVVHSPQPVHGRLSLVYHDSSALFTSVSFPLPRRAVQLTSPPLSPPSLPL